MKGVASAWLATSFCCDIRIKLPAHKTAFLLDQLAIFLLFNFMSIGKQES